MNYRTIRYEVRDRILTITLDRPDKLNAFTVEMAAELIDAIRRASDDDQVGVVVVTGAGKAFCAGMELATGGNVFGLDDGLQPSLEDLQQRMHSTEIEGGLRDTGGQLTLALLDCKKPLIAAINGAAVGIGATMTCAMDVRLAAESARIGFVFNRIGITPEACSTWFLPRLVGMGKALEWCLTADLLDSAEVLRHGFVSAVVPGDQLLERAYGLARRMTGHSPVALALTRQMLWRNSAQQDPVLAHQVESLAIYYASQGAAKEGIAAFLEKRAPRFTDLASRDMPPFYPWW